MFATLSPESRIKDTLREIGCADWNLAKISGIVGKTRLSEALSGQKSLENHTATRLLEIVQEMRELQDTVGVPIDWTKTQQVGDALFAKRLQKASHDVSGDSKLFDELVSQATSEL